MKRIIINADDFGLTLGCSLGIIKAMKEGVVTSTTLMINMPRAYDAIELAKENNINSLGLHLNLTKGKPISSLEDVSSLVDSNGNFKKLNEIFLYGSYKEMEKELRLQVKAFLNTGMKLSHLDSHHHIHMRDELHNVCISIAKDYNVPLRKIVYKQIDMNEYNVKTTDEFYTCFYGDNISVELLKEIINKAPQGLSEIMTHPGIVDDELMNISIYNTQRQIELDILTNPQLIEWINNNGIELVSFEDAF